MLVQVGDTFTGPPTLVYEPGTAREGMGSDGFTYTVTDTGDDEDGPLSDAADVAINITQAVADGQVTIDADGIVRVGGTGENNSIVITRALFGGTLFVRIDGQLVSRYIRIKNINEIRVWGREGNDTISVLLVNVPTFMHGGNGDDRIFGGLGPNLVFGGTGADHLIGGLRDDILVGGDGSDVLVDTLGDDVLVGGNVANQFTIDFLRQVLPQWSNGQSQNSRFQSGLLDDEAVDLLFNSLGDDWFGVGEDDLAIDLFPFDDDAVTFV
jgi:Ca2+-binding RTX toxin-like protein